MSYLRETQDWMSALVRRRRSLVRDPAVTAEVALRIAGNDRLTPAEQLEIYRQQFWLRHTASLLEDFPGLSGMLGQREWEGLVESYLEEVAPTSWTLRDLGARLPAHVERCTSLPHHRACVDMARVEWAYVELFDAEDVAGLDPTRLAALPEEAWLSARVVTSPALALVAVEHAVADLRAELRARPGNPVEIPAADPHGLALSRDAHGHLHHERLDATAFALLLRLARGEALVPACEGVAAELPGAGDALTAHAFDWFATWANRGWIVDVVAT